MQTQDTVLGSTQAKSTNGDLHSYDATARAGERSQQSSNGVDHTAVSEEFKLSDAIDLSGNTSTTVYPGKCLCGGVWVEVTIGTAAATLDDDTTTRATLPVALPIGGTPGFKPTIFNTSLIVNPADSSTGTIRVWYRPLDNAVTWAA